MTESIEGRINLLRDVPKEGIHEAFDSIRLHFEESWLSDRTGTNRIQALWRKRNWLSTAELYSFGVALAASSKLNQTWVKNQVKIIKQPDVNNQNGAIFEIICVGGFSTSAQQVLPARASQKGHDLDVQFRDGKKLRVSAKSYSKSIHELRFEQKIKIAEKIFLESINGWDQSWQMHVLLHEYPSESAWQKLLESLKRVPPKRDFKTIGNGWSVSQRRLITENEQVRSKEFPSYIFNAQAAYHNNEKRNIYSKIESAIAGMKNIDNSNQSFSTLIMRVPALTNIGALASWTNEYLDGRPQDSLGAVLFYRPELVITKDTTYINHTMVPAHFGCAERAQDHPLATFTFPLGSVSSEPPEWQINGERLGECYVYQAGSIYQNAINGEGHINRIAHGVETKSVFNINGSQLIISSKDDCSPIILSV